jgi:23S rRNA pseudouridine2605 synthase
VKERIQKVLAAAGVSSRRHIEEMVSQGRISVNGKVVFALPVMIDPQRDRVRVDDEPVALHSASEEKRLYVLMNKPRGVYSTNVAQGEQTRAIDLLPPNFPRVYPVGRLDADSKGLLLLTNDGDLTNRLTHPRFGVAKTYRAVVDGYVHGDTLDELKRGIWLADPHKGGFKTGRTQLSIVSRSRHKTILEITIREGRNRQVRRMLAKVGHKVRDLTRIRMGPLTLKGLSPGQSRPLHPREVQALLKLPMESTTSGANTMAESRARRPAETETRRRPGRPKPARRH